MFDRQMELLGNFTLWLLIAILSVAAVLVVWQLLTSRINLSGLLIDKTNGAFSPGRLQLLLFTLLVAASYILMLLGFAGPDSLIPAPVPFDYSQLPPIPDWIIAVIGGSSASYLGGKSSATIGRVIVSMMNQNR